jgi:hypothetical protein
LRPRVHTAEVFEVRRGRKTGQMWQFRDFLIHMKDYSVAIHRSKCGKYDYIRTRIAGNDWEMGINDS